jgi:hypothetical protein
VADSHRDDPWEKGDDSPGACAGCKVPVLWLDLEKKIPQRAANDPHISSGTVDFFHYPENIAGDKGKSNSHPPRAVPASISTNHAAILPSLRFSKRLDLFAIANIIG